MPEEKPKLDVQRLIELVDGLPTMPAVATKILRVAGSEDVDAAEVTRLIASDQGLASKVLGTCNSAYYGLPQRVKTLSRAVGLLGFKAVRNLVLVHSLPWKRSSTPSFADQMIFTHAGATAVAARVLAGQTKRSDPEEALLGGLLHDAGRLALNLAAHEEYEPVLKAIYNLEGESIELERRALGVDHTQMGEQILRKWSFPEELVRVAQTHHDPVQQLSQVTLVVRAADELSHLTGRGVRALTEPVTAVPLALGSLGISLDDLEELEKRVAQAIEQSQDIFAL
jgi:putative nucleotidyltransferase with HDIG domain